MGGHIGCRECLAKDIEAASEAEAFVRLIESGEWMKYRGDFRDELEKFEHTVLR